jgi:hypothetical protein
MPLSSASSPSPVLAHSPSSESQRSSKLLSSRALPASPARISSFLHGRAPLPAFWVLALFAARSSHTLYLLVRVRVRVRPRRAKRREVSARCGSIHSSRAHQIVGSCPARLSDTWPSLLIRAKTSLVVVPARVQFTASSTRFSFPSHRFVTLLCRAPGR